jgi:hypothetical protein
LDAWEAFVLEELTPTIAESAHEGGLAWNDAFQDEFSFFMEELILRQPELAGALQTLLTESGVETIQNLPADYMSGIVDLLTSNMTTREKMDALEAMGLTWAESAALGFANLPALLEAIAGIAATAVKTSFSSGVEVSSPSKVFKHYGEMVTKGFELGLESGGMFSMFKPHNGGMTQPALNVDVSGVQPHGDTKIEVHGQTKDLDASIRLAGTMAGIVRRMETKVGR